MSPESAPPETTPPTGEVPAGDQRRRTLFRAIAVLAMLVVSAVLLEVAVLLLVRGGMVTAPEPTRSKADFWDGSHEVFGVWHRPNAAANHGTECFEATYRTNSVGARDRERRQQAAAPRVAVLGDSFMEGWGLAAGQRLSNLLEANTGIEHLNFGMSHFGPYQHYLAYRDMVSQYDHDYVLVGLVPLNDFFDLDYERARKAPSYEYRYRPYLLGSYPDYTTYHYREGWLQGLLRRHSYAYNGFTYALWTLRGDDGLGGGPPSRLESGLVHSYFYDFSDEQYGLLLHSLELLLTEARGKRVVIFLIPTLRDFARYHQSGESLLYRRLQKLEDQHDLQVVDLLPYMYGVTPEWKNYHFTCDYHWSAVGNQVAAGILRRQLAGFFY